MKSINASDSICATMGREVNGSLFGLIDCQTSLEVIFLWGLALLVFLVILGATIYLKSKKRRYETYSSLLKITYRGKLYLLYQRTNLFIAASSIVVFLIFIPLTNEMIVNVTAVYATILFLNNSLRNPVPLLSVEFERATSATDPDDGNKEIIRQIVNVRNEGRAITENLKCRFRIFDLEYDLKNDWQEKEFEDSPKTIEGGDNTKFEIYLDSVDEIEHQQYKLEIELKPSPEQRHFTIRELATTSRPDD